MSTYDPENPYVTLWRSLIAYIQASIGTNVYEFVPSYPRPDDVAKRMPLKKTLIHFEVDDIENRRLGLGDGVVDAAYDDPAFTIEEHEGNAHIVTFDIGVWASHETGGPHARLQARQHLDRLLHGPSAQRACLAATDGVDIIEFTGGRNLTDTISDIPVFRTVDLTLRVRVYSRKRLTPQTFIDDILQEPGLTIDDNVPIVVP